MKTKEPFKMVIESADRIDEYCQRLGVRFDRECFYKMAQRTSHWWIEDLAFRMLEMRERTIG